MQQSPETIVRHPITGGGVAGIIAGIIEYALSWGTSGLLAAVAAGVTMLILIIWDRKLTPKQEKKRSTDDYVNSEANEEPGPKTQLTPVPLPVQRISPPPVKLTAPPPLVDQQRIFSRRTPTELVALLKGQTGWEAAGRIKPHLGTWLSIEGYVNDIHLPSHGTIMVCVDLSKNFSTLLVFLSFDEKRWHDRLRILTVGDSITTIGKICEIKQHRLSLEDCELVDS